MCPEKRGLRYIALSSYCFYTSNRSHEDMTVSNYGWMTECCNTSILLSSWTFFFLSFRFVKKSWNLGKYWSTWSNKQRIPRSRVLKRVHILFKEHGRYNPTFNESINKKKIINIIFESQIQNALKRYHGSMPQPSEVYFNLPGRGREGVT